MNSQLQKQILLGTLSGILISGLVWFLLNGKRAEIKTLESNIQTLKQEVAKGNALKQNAEKLRVEIAQQEKRIDELIKIMPSEQDRGELPYRIKKLADSAGIEQQSFTNENALKQQFYTAYPVKFDFKAGFHSFCQLASLVSGYEKIINLTDISMTRDKDIRGLFPAKVSCKVSAFVYNPAPAAEPTKPAAGPSAAPSSSKKTKGGEGE